MRARSIRLALIALVLTLPLFSMAKSLNSKLDRLGGNEKLVNKAKAMNPDNRFRIVQKRKVDRHWRFEAGMNYGMHASSDPYVDTNAWGGYADLHVNPRFSFGARYNYYQNDLTSEGRRVLDKASTSNQSTGEFSRPEVDYPLNSTLGVVSFYPLYGKLNFFDQAVTQFDIYVLAGAGQMSLESGDTSTWTAGGGVGLWMNNHFASRLEVRYQAYEDLVSTQSRDQNMVVTTLAIGFML